MGWSSTLMRTLSDLVLPGECAGCGSPDARQAVCLDCADLLRAAVGPVRPRAAPADLPACVSAAVYEGPVRALILAYKERGQRALAAPLGAALAVAVAHGLAGVDRDWPLTLVPVPATAAAVRARYGDHMLLLAHRAAARLAGAGWRVRLAPVLRARPRADSAHLNREARAEAARAAFAGRRGAARLRGVAADSIVVALDDVLTTGATLAAVARELSSAGTPAAFAATVAATRLRGVAASAPFAAARNAKGDD